MKREELTRRQGEYLDFIKDFIRRNGIAPTYAEMAEGLNTTTSSAAQTVKRMARKGYVKVDRRPRMLKVL